MKRKKQQRLSKNDGESIAHHFHHRLREALFIFIVTLSIYLLLALSTYHRADPGWSHFVNTSQVLNAGGRVGAWLADILLYFCGYTAYVFPLVLSYAAWLVFYYRHWNFGGRRFRTSLFIMRLVGFLLILIGGTSLINLNVTSTFLPLPYDAGGIIGNVISVDLLNVFNSTGATLILVAATLLGTTLFTGLSWLQLIEKIGSWMNNIIQKFTQMLGKVNWRGRLQKLAQMKFTIKLPKINFNLKSKLKPTKVQSKVQSDFAQMKSQSTMANPPLATAQLADRIESPQLTINRPTIEEDMTKALRSKSRPGNSKVSPKLSLLDAPDKKQMIQHDALELEIRSREVEQRLADFGVTVKVVAVHPGPVVTRYELELAAGTKVSKITNLAKDLARSLSVISVRVVEVIPGKSVIGIELPNAHRAIVSLQEVLASKAYINAHSVLTLALGKDIAGHPVVVDLVKMPHLLVAGTTGSGKSVSLNAMLLSLLYKATPQQLRLILIDPKMLELAVYDGIPHLLTPVVTDMKDAASALRWSVMEMERRYRLMASLGVRNVAGYNQKVRQARERGAPLLDPLSAVQESEKEELQELPKIVVLADEFADMMVVVGKKVETLIARLAQKARAAGIHLILATQRPSVDVITGLIKANIPTRIAFQVSSKIDSRTILDQQGAEQLLGHGDMLYLPPGSGVPVRVHGAFVSDDEVHRVVKYLKQSGEPNYIEAILDESAANDLSGYTEAAMGENNDAEQDPIYDEAVKFVTQTRRVSISSIQRRFKIGYNRAARIVEAMEASNVVSRMENNGTREVLAPPPPPDVDGR